MSAPREEYLSVGDWMEKLAELLVDSNISLAEAETQLGRAMITAAMKRTGGNACVAAKLVGIHRNTLSARFPSRLQNEIRREEARRAIEVRCQTRQARSSRRAV